MIDIAIFYADILNLILRKTCRCNAVAIAAEVKDRDTKRVTCVPCVKTKASILITCSRWSIRNIGITVAHIQLYIRRRAGAISAIASIRFSLHVKPGNMST